MMFNGNSYLVASPEEIRKIRNRENYKMNISNHKATPELKGDYVVEHGIKQLVIKSKCREDNSGKYGTKIKCDVDIGGESEIVWSINKSTLGNISMKHGDDTDQWLDKVINITTKVINGSTCIFGTPE